MALGAFALLVTDPAAPALATVGAGAPPGASASVSPQSVSNPTAGGPSVNDGGAGLSPSPAASGASGGAPVPGSSSASTEAVAGAAQSANNSGARNRPASAAPSDGRRDHAAFAERYLRRLVLRFRSCLAAIAPVQATALMLRTGLGFTRSYGPGAVARRLRVSVMREAQIERAAVSALETAARHGSCPRPRQPAALGPLLGEPEAPAQIDVRSAVAAASSSKPVARHRRHRAPHRAAKPRRTISGASAGLPIPRPGSTASDLLLILLAALLGAAAVLTVITRREALRSRLGPAGAGPGGAGAVAGTALERRRHQDTVVRQRSLQDALAPYRASGGPKGSDLAVPAGLRGAVAALRRADERGDPASAAGLGTVLEGQGDIEGALAAYRRADERGNAMGALKLGRLLADRGDLEGATAAYRRACDRGDQKVAEEARRALLELTGR